MDPNIEKPLQDLLLEMRRHPERYYLGPDLKSIIPAGEHVSVLACHQGRPEVHLFRGTAVCSFAFLLSLSCGGVPFQVGGEDILVCRRRGGRWDIVWRKIVNVVDW